jgi:hypothetical protein
MPDEAERLITKIAEYWRGVSGGTPLVRAVDVLTTGKFLLKGNAKRSSFSG